MKIDDHPQGIAPSDIELIDWLSVKYAKPTTGRSSRFVPTLEQAQAVVALFPQLTLGPNTVGVLRYPGGIQKSGKLYGLVCGYRRWQGAMKQRLPEISAQVIHATLGEYEDQGFRVWLCLVANHPRYSVMLSQTINKSERTAYRLNTISCRLHEQLIDTPMSQAAQLALIRVPADEQMAVIDELERTQRGFTAQNIRAAIRVRAGGSSLPDLKPLRDATKLCLQLLKRADWGANDLEWIEPVIVEHALTLKAFTIYLGTQQAETIGSSGPSQRVASRGTTP